MFVPAVQLVARSTFAAGWRRFLVRTNPKQSEALPKMIDNSWSKSWFLIRKTKKTWIFYWAIWELARYMYILYKVKSPSTPPLPGSCLFWKMGGTSLLFLIRIVLISSSQTSETGKGLTISFNQNTLSLKTAEGDQRQSLVNVDSCSSCIWPSTFNNCLAQLRVTPEIVCCPSSAEGGRMVWNQTQSLWNTFLKSKAPLGSSGSPGSLDKQEALSIFATGCFWCKHFPERPFVVQLCLVPNSPRQMKKLSWIHMLHK